MESSPMVISEEIGVGRGGLGSPRRRPSRRLQPAKRARVPGEIAVRIAQAKRKRARPLTVMMPVRSPILRMMPLTARSASPTLRRSPSTTAPRSPTAVSTIQCFVYPPNLGITQLAQHHCSMEDLPEALLAEIVKRINRTSDLNSLSLVSKQLYTIEAGLRGAIRVGCGICPASLCSRFPNLSKVEIDYSGWTPSHGNQLDNQGLLVMSSCCPSLTDLTLSFCSCINDSGLGCLAYCKKLMSLRLNSTQNITSDGVLSVAVGCKSLSALQLIDCEKICSVEWLEYLGRDRSLEELVIKKCEDISQNDLLKFGPGWMKLQKFEFEIKGRLLDIDRSYDPSYDAHSLSRYDFFCESLKDLRLVRIETGPEIGLRFLLGKCKSLEKLCLEYVKGLNDNDMIALSQSCSNLKSISLWLVPLYYDYVYRTSFTDDSLKALACGCPMLQTVELTFAGCVPDWPSEIAFTQKGFVVLVQSCPVRVLMLNGANFFDDEGMKALSSAPFLETLELVDCKAITDAGMCFIARTPCLSNLTLRWCAHVTDGGIAELVHAQKLETLIVEGCRRVSPQGVHGAAISVHYSAECALPSLLKRM